MSLARNRLSVDSLKLNFRKNIINNYNENNNNKKLSPQKNIQFFKSAQLKKLKTLLSLNDAKILEIKRSKAKYLSAFHLVSENDKYKNIQKSIQNKILNISMEIITNCKFEPDLKEFKSQQSKLKIKNLASLDKLTKKLAESNKLKKSIHQSRNTAKLTQLKEILNERNRRIKRIHNLYDSFGEDESDKDKEQENYGLNPRSIFIDVYDIFILISCLYSLFYMPYRLAKTKMIINKDEYFVLLMIYFSEIIFIIDLIFGFFRWFYNNELKLVSNSYMIISNYLYGDFILDLIMAIPFYSILRHDDNIQNIYETKYNEKYILIKILTCLKAFKIFKLNKIKNNRVTYFFNRRFTKNYYFERIYQISNFILIICSMFNLIICIHIYMAELSYPNWIISFNLEDKSFLSIYLASFYFIIATMTSVGYGDIVCISSEERYFQIVLLSIGLVAYSWIISAVGDYVKNKSRAMDNFNRDMAKLEEIRVACPNMPFKLYNKIQQHIQRMLTQNKKYENNILINSLPYTLQNSVLFQIHQNEISKFTFFKNCDNSDFILKVLTHFIPIFSKKNIVLVGEGEFFENIFFIKDGRLSLEAIIDLDNIEMSIEKYLKYRFEEIEKIEDFSEQDNSFQKSIIMDNKNFVINEQKSNKLLGIINKQFENVGDISYMHESNIEEEIGKCDFNMENEDLYEGNIQYIRILDLLKNEYFGGILMFLNIPNPLSLRVKSKRVELYVLRKKDAFNIKRDYPNIWQRINRKSTHNIKSLKSLTLDIINRYCEMNGIIVKGKEIIKSKFNTNYVNNVGKRPYINSNKENKKININSNKSGNNNKIIELKLKEEPKIVDNNNLNFLKIKKTSLKSSFKPINMETNNRKSKNEKVKLADKNFSSKLNNRLKFKTSNKNNNGNLEAKEKKKNSKAVSANNLRKRSISKNSENNSSYLNLSEDSINKKFNKKSSPNQINYNLIQSIIFQKTQNTKTNNKKYKKNKSSNKGRLSHFVSLSEKSLQGQYINSNKVKKVSNKKNNFIITGISSINELYDELNKSNSYNNNFNCLTSESTISLQINSSYKNINEVGKGKYINNNNFQNLIEKIVKYYIKHSSNKKYSYYTEKIQKAEFNSENIRLSDKNNIFQKNSIPSEKNKNSRTSKFKKEKKINSNNMNKKLKKDPNKTNETLTKDKNKSESLDNKSINSMNQLNTKHINKEQEILSESNNCNASSEQLNQGNVKYRHVQTFQKIKKEIENNSKEKKKVKKGKSVENLYLNNVINNKSGNSFHEVNLNYVNNFCLIS